MSREESGSGEWASSEAKDWKDGRHKRENSHVLPHAGEVGDTKTRQALTALHGVYERAYKRGWIDGDWPDSVTELSTYRRWRGTQQTEAFARAVDQGDAVDLRQQVGSQNDEIDVSGWRDIEHIREIAVQRHLRLYIYGEPGTGKTRSGSLVARHWVEERVEEGHRDALVLTNIRTLADESDRVRWVSNWAQLKDVMHSEMDDILAENTRPVLFLFDEASSQAAGRGKQGHEASTKLATLVYKIRKFAGAIVIIGHDGKDLHPAVRELCTVCEKESKKVARFYETVKNREGVDPITPTITGWPDSMWQPNDKDPAPWSWDDGQEGGSGESESHISREDAYRELAIWTVVDEKTRNGDDALSFEKIAQKRLNGLYSGEWCRRRWKEYDSGEHADTVATVQEAIA
ncbi:ATP-binding protein [Haloarchaeobius iranensis]